MAEKTVAIVGSGPAGLAAAERLAGAGLKVTVFEQLPVFGGLLAYAIPEFRICMESVKKRVEAAKGKGVEFIQKKVISAKALLDDFDFVLLAIGAGKNAEMDIKGEKIKGVLRALDFLYAEKVDGKAMVSKDDNVAIIGGGNGAIDAARTVIRQQGKATIVYRRTEREMPAYKKEVEAAKKEAVVFEFLLNPVEFVGKEKLGKIRFAKMQLSNPDETGRRRPIPTGEVVEKEFDKAIVAVGQNQKLSWLEKEGIKIFEGYRIVVDNNYQTSLKNVYAAGDCMTEARTITDATKTGMAAADAIIEAAGKIREQT